MIQTATFLDTLFEVHLLKQESPPPSRVNPDSGCSHAAGYHSLRGPVT